MTTPLHAEPVRRMLMQSLEHHLITGARRPELPNKPDEVVDVTGFIIGPSELRLRVKLENGTFRTFTVMLRENR
jgi:hypothetical protein